ncbi:hypothetical protein V3429_02245 [Aeromonas jandaei]|uniref:hypothetical protein n=1 Tax=Aeromonas jandaei TaxID=650 RepID=UPI0030CB5A01
MSKENNNVFNNGNFTAIFKGDSGNLLTATSMIYEVDGDEVIADVDDGFKLLYTFLYDQYRSFQSQGKDLFAEWETIFKALGRTYNTKKSKDNVKLLEDCGLLKQIKMPNSNARIKIVADVSLKNIRFINPDYDAWRAEQTANNAERVAEYAEFKAEKEKATKQAKNVEIKTVRTGAKNESGDTAKAAVVEVECVTSSEGSGNTKDTGVDVKQQNKVEPESRTNWELHSQALIAQNPKFNELNDGQKMQVMLAVNQCRFTSYYVIQDDFNTRISILTHKHTPQPIEKPKSSYSIAPPAIQAMNDVFDYDDFGDDDNIPF